MPSALETHRSFVNTWECDENQHMNVQFYAKRFDEARRVFDMLCGAEAQVPLPADRHIRYHAELHAGATTVTHSAFVTGGQLAGRVVHMMHHAETGTLCATALETASAAGGNVPEMSEEEARAALPRTLSAAPLSTQSIEQFKTAGGRATNYGLAVPSDCDAQGRLTERAIVGRFSDGAPHTWAMSGVDVNWLLAQKLGRVAVEMKITHHGEGRSGEILMLHSAPVACSGKTVTLRHELYAMPAERPIASGEVVALILDLKTRRPTALPEAVAAHLRGADD